MEGAAVCHSPTTAVLIPPVVAGTLGNRAALCWPATSKAFALVATHNLLTTAGDAEPTEFAPPRRLPGPLPPPRAQTPSAATRRGPVDAACGGAIHDVGNSLHNIPTKITICISCTQEPRGQLPCQVSSISQTPLLHTREDCKWMTA